MKPEATPSRTRTAFHDFALVALMMPALGLVLNFILVAAGTPWDSRWRTVPFALHAIGILAGIVALSGIGKHGVRGILLPSLLGLIIGGGLVGYSIFFTNRVLKPEAAANAAAANTYQDFDGWVGAESIAGTATLTVISIHPDSPVGRAFNLSAGTNLQIISLGVDNARGAAPLAVAPDQIELIYPTAVKIKALAPAIALSGVRTNRDHLLSRASGPVTVPAGQNAPDLSAFFPAGTDLSTVVGVAIPVNGQIALIPGRYLLSAQKKQQETQGLAPGAKPTADSAAPRLRP